MGERETKRRNITHDTAFANGMRVGWNFRDNHDDEGYHRAYTALRNEVKSARRELKEARDHAE